MLDSSKLKGKMAEAGETQKTLASKIGMSTNSLSNKLKGKRDFTVIEVKKICDVLGISDNAEKAKIFLA